MRWLVVMIGVSGCGGDKEPDDGSGDTVVDADADADADSDSDTDTDTDADTDTSTPWDCVDVQLGAVETFAESGTTVGMGDDLLGACGGTLSEDVALRFEAPAASRYELALGAGTDYDAVLYALRDCDGEQLACVDEDSGAGGERLVLELEAGETILVVVDGFDDFPTGPQAGAFELLGRRVPDQEQVCDDGTDDDLDGLPDCFDTDCDGTAACLEVCDDDLDDNGNGLVDCLDGSCAADAACAAACPDEDAGSVVPATLAGDTTGDLDELQPSCVPAVASDVAVTFEAPQAGDYVFDLAGSSFDAALAVLDSCGGVELGCGDDGVGHDARQPSVVVSLAAGQQVVVSVDGTAPDEHGPFQLNVARLRAAEGDCGSARDLDDDGLRGCLDPDCAGDPACLETCDDQLDNDLDTRVDCEDTDCVADDACQPFCPRDVLTAPQTVQVYTRGLPSSDRPTCAPGGAPDYSWEFTAPADGTFTFDTLGSDFDTVLYATDVCDGAELTCNDDVYGLLQSEIQLTLTAGQTVIIVVDGYGSAWGNAVLNSN